MSLNKNEIVVGILLTCILIPLMGWVAILCAPICGFLWALSGADKQAKIWRRLCVPLVWAGGIFLNGNYNPLLFLAVPASFGFLCIGYGIPDSTDEGSFLGRFFVRLAKGNLALANFLTRGTIYFLALAPIIIGGFFLRRKKNS